MRPSFLPRTVSILAAAAFLEGCAATDAAINHSKMDVQTHMSETVFLDPVPPSAKTIYIGVRNTSDHPEVDLRNPLAGALASRGYQIVPDRDQAHYMLQINVLQAGQIEPKSKTALLSARYGDPLLGVGMGAAVGSVASDGNPYATAGGGLVGGLAALAIDHLVQDVTFTVVVDIQISERPLKGGKVRQTSYGANSQANGSLETTATGARTGASPQTGNANAAASLHLRHKEQFTEEEADFKQYQIREVAYADQMNLKFEDSVPVLLARLSSSLSNLFE